MKKTKRLDWQIKEPLFQIRKKHATYIFVPQYIALNAVPAYRAYLVSAFPAHLTSFSQNFFNPQWWNVY